MPQSYEFFARNRVFSCGFTNQRDGSFGLLLANQRDGSFGLPLAYVWCAYGMQTKSYYVCSGNVVWG